MELNIGLYDSLALLLIVLRISVFILKFLYEVNRGRVIKMTSHVDKSGCVEIYIENRGKKDLPISTCRLVRDKSWWMFVLRNVLIGIDRFSKFDEIEFDKESTFPKMIKSNTSVKLIGYIARRYDFKDLEAKFRLPIYAMSEIGAYNILKKLVLLEDIYREENS